MRRRPLERRAAARGRNGGFLLPETLATFTISAFILLGLVSASSVLLGAIDRSINRVQNVDDLGRALDAIARDVGGLQRARWNGIEPQSFVFRGGPNSIFFARRERGLDGGGVTKVVALREIIADGGTRLMRSEARLSARASSFDDVVFGAPREIWTGPARLRFSYLPPRQDAKPAPPTMDFPSGPTLPAAITVEAVDRATKKSLVSLRVTIRADADIGCLEEGGGDAPGGGAATADATAQSATPDATPTGGGGVDFGPPPAPTALAAPILSAADAAQAAKSDAFCSRPQRGKKNQPGAPAAPQATAGPTSPEPAP